MNDSSQSRPGSGRHDWGHTSRFISDLPDDEESRDEDDKLQVLFVDDEQSVLDGLRRMLRTERRSWAMRFANSPEEALRQMEAQPCDIVVSDLRMPNMSGAELLTCIRERWPGTIRISLSGEADKAALFRTISPAHQYLAKPCDPDLLRAAVSRAGALRRVLGNREISRIVGSGDDLPSLPALYDELRTLLASDDVSLQRVGQVIGRDIGMTAKILKLVNSALFGLRRHITSPVDAVNVLGLETVHGLVLNNQALDVIASQTMQGVNLEALNGHALRVAIMAREIVTYVKGSADLADAAFIAGMMHDLGRVIFAARLPDQYGHLVKSAIERGIPLYRAEFRVFQATHGEVGAYLLGLWGIADTIIEAVALHHEPLRSGNSRPLVLAALHVANAIDEHQHPEHLPTTGIEQGMVQRMGWGDTLGSLIGRCIKILARDEEPQGDQP